MTHKYIKCLVDVLKADSNNVKKAHFWCVPAWLKLEIKNK